MPVLPESYGLAEGVDFPEIQVEIRNSAILEEEHQKKEDNQLEKSQEKKKSMEDNLEGEEVAELRMAAMAEENELGNSEEKPSCGEITKDTVWKEGTLIDGTVKIDDDTEVLTGVKGTEVTARPKKYTGFTVDLSHPSGKSSGIVKGDGSLSLKFFYDRDVYEVGFNLNGGYGEIPEIQKIRYGGFLKPVNEPARDGYSFKGWHMDVEVHVKDDRDGNVTGGISKISYQMDEKKVTLPEEKFEQSIVESYDFMVKISGKGKHTLQVDAEDHAGNINSQKINLTISGEKETPLKMEQRNEDTEDNEESLILNSPKGNGNAGNSGNSKSPRGAEPKTGDSAHVNIYATIAMIAGFSYLLLYFEGENGITEQEKEEIIYRLVSWAKQGGMFRRLLGLAVIFLFLSYYHSIGKSVEVEWREVCAEKTRKDSGY